MYRSSSSPSRATCAASASWMRMTTTTTSRSSPVPSREVCRGRADTPNPVGEEEDMTRLEDAVWHYRPKKPFFVICLWPSVMECAILDIFCQTPCSGYFGGYSNFDQQFFGILFIPPPPGRPRGKLVGGVTVFSDSQDSLSSPSWDHPHRQLKSFMHLADYMIR